MKTLFRITMILSAVMLIFSSCNKQGTYSFKTVSASNIVEASRHQEIFDYVTGHEYFQKEHTYTGGRRDVANLAYTDFLNACEAIDEGPIQAKLVYGENFRMILTYDDGETVGDYSWIGKTH